MRRFRAEHNETLKNRLFSLLRSGKMSHAILLEGGDCETRALFASEIAKGFVCTGRDKPCGNCAACKKAENATHPDIITVGGDTTARSILVDKIRQVREDAFIVPNEADKKVYILAGADKMTVQASNALLKVLEEPPSCAVFILTCQSASVLLETIRSRCQIFSLQVESSEAENEEALNLAAKSLEALFKPTAFELLGCSAAFVKDRSLFLAVLEAASALVYQAILVAASSAKDAPAHEISRMLAVKLRLKALFLLAEEISCLQKMAEQNCNMALLSTHFCARLYRIAVQ